MAIVRLRDPQANSESPHSSPDATHGEHRGTQKPMSHQSKPHQFQSNPSKPRQIQSPLNLTDPSPDNRRLGSYLLEAGLINHAQIEVVLNDQQMMQEMRFGEVLVARGWIKPETIDFVMRRVVEPDRAYQAHQEYLSLPETQSVPEPQFAAPPEVSPPPFPTSPPQSRVMARARSLDGDIEFDIVDDQSGGGRSQNLPQTTPLIRSTDSGGRNDRKSLPSIPDGDGVNWAG